MKDILVRSAGSGALTERKIAPGTTAGELLQDINLPNGLLSNGENGEIFANAESLYDKVKNGQTLYASSPASVGASFFETVVNIALKRLDPRFAQVETSNGGGALRRPPVVPRQQTPYWQMRGWKRQGNSFTGKFVTPYGAYIGSISQMNPAEIEFYIQHPPDCVFTSSHAACFQSRGGSWFFVHMSRCPKDVSSGILVIEQLIASCFKGRA
jgi:hypothetical protein